MTEYSCSENRDGVGGVSHVYFACDGFGNEGRAVLMDEFHFALGAGDGAVYLLAFAVNVGNNGGLFVLRGQGVTP